MGQSVADEEDHVSLAEFNTLKTRLETLELQQNKDNERLRLLEGKDECGATRRQSLVDEFDDNGTRRVTSSSNLRASQVERLYDNFELPADTYTLLMTEEIWSVPFWAGFIAPVLSATCLVMALKNVYDRVRSLDSSALSLLTSSQTRILIAMIRQAQVITSGCLPVYKCLSE